MSGGFRDTDCARVRYASVIHTSYLGFMALRVVVVGQLVVLLIGSVLQLIAILILLCTAGQSCCRIRTKTMAVSSARTGFVMVY